MSKYITKQCPVCQREFTPTNSGRQRTCSFSCRNKFRCASRVPFFNSTDNTYTLELNKGYFVCVDSVDADLFKNSWHISQIKHHTVYAKRTIRLSKDKTTQQILHRVIMARVLGRELMSREMVDHIDCNGLNCRRSNLRLATNQQNQANQVLSERNTSGYKGVYKSKANGRWCAAIRNKGKKVFLGTYNTPKEAHEAYCRAGKEFHGEFFNSGE